MATITTHNANVVLPTEQFQQQVTLPLEQQAHLMWEVFPIKFKSRLTLQAKGGADSSSCGSCEPRNTVESSSCGSCKSRNTVANS